MGNIEERALQKIQAVTGDTETKPTDHEKCSLLWSRDLWRSSLNMQRAAMSNARDIALEWMCYLFPDFKSVSNLVIKGGSEKSHGFHRPANADS